MAKEILGQSFHGYSHLVEHAAAGINLEQSLWNLALEEPGRVIRDKELTQKAFMVIGMFTALLTPRGRHRYLNDIMAVMVMEESVDKDETKEDKEARSALKKERLSQAFDAAARECQDKLAAFLPAKSAIAEVIQQTLSSMRRSARNYLYLVALPLMMASGALDKDEAQAIKVDKCHWQDIKYRVQIQPVAQLMKGVFIIDVSVPLGQQPNGFAQWRPPPTGQHIQDRLGPMMPPG